MLFLQQRMIILAPRFKQSQIFQAMNGVSLFPYVLVWRISPIFMAMKFSVMDVLDDFILFYFFVSFDIHVDLFDDYG